MLGTEDNLEMRPIALGKDVVANTPADLVSVILAASDKQVEAKAIISEEVRADFRLSSDALNYARVAWRCAEEWATGIFDPSLARQVREGICTARGYDADDFDSALHATGRRARLPFGWTAIDFALRRSRLRPIRLLVPELAGKPVPTAIAGIALMLHEIQGGEPILLPIDQIRGLLHQRKIVISGAVQRLVEAGILLFEDRTYWTGKAREFRFTAIEGEHYAFVETSGSSDL